MQLPRKLVLLGAVIGLIPIGLGIAALVTPLWIKIDPNYYSLLICRPNECPTSSQLPLVKGLEIAGVAAIAVGVIITVILDMLTKNQWINLLPQILLIAGPTLILIGLIFYIKAVIDSHTYSVSLSHIMDLGYSIILMIVACLAGFITAIYFAFVAGFGRHHHHHYPRPSTIVVRESVRF